MYVRTGLSGYRGLGVNDQIVPSTYTGPVGGFACNTAGGYSLHQPSCYMTQQCMTASDFAAAQAACDAGPSPPPPAAPPPPVAPPAPPVVTGAPVSPAAGLPGGPPLPPVATLPASSGSTMLDSAVSWVEANPLLAAGIAAGVVLLLVKL